TINVCEVFGQRYTHHKSHVPQAEDLTVDSQVVGLPLPTVTWRHRQQLITPSVRKMVNLHQLLNWSLPLRSAAVQLQLRIKGIQRADDGVYSCKAANR
ncbi:unnamed protein product, partial [Porites evermanni]